MSQPTPAYEAVMPYYSEEPPAKKQKTLACLRCRRRKQKCDDQRPCANCTRSNETCQETVPSTLSLANGLSGVPVFPGSGPWVDGLSVLEERVSRLEKTVLPPDQTPAHASGPDPRSAHFEASAAPTAGSERGAGPPSPRRDSRTSPVAGGGQALGLVATFSHAGLADGVERDVPPTLPSPPVLDAFAEETLIAIYRDKAHSRYPFLRLAELRSPSGTGKDPVRLYFFNMVLSIGLLLDGSSRLHLPPDSHQTFHRLAVTRYLTHVLAETDRLLHIQAHLLLAMHALYSPSSEKIISIASATMRYCVMSQLHIAEAEPYPSDVAAMIRIQTRRRVFWSAYSLDRAVGTMFDLPFSIPDYQITVKMYANIEDGDIEARCRDAFPRNPPGSPTFTSVSSALHVVYCRQIQSEILNITLHRDFASQFDQLSNWRLRILGKLDRWKSLCHRYSDARSKSHTSSEWLNMIYNYSLAMLYRPTRSSACGPAGDWTIKACVQACLIFRRFQKSRSVSEAWLALIAQFKCGVALLYCFYATPPQRRGATYDGPEVAEAVRACSIVLSLLADRWPQSACLRDCFDVLAKEIPLAEAKPRSDPCRMIHADSTAQLLSMMDQLELLVVHRDTLRMVREMATETFPSDAASADESYGAEPEVAAQLESAPASIENDASSLHTAMTGNIFEPLTPQFLMPELTSAEEQNLDYASMSFPGIFDPASAFEL